MFTVGSHTNMSNYIRGAISFILVLFFENAVVAGVHVVVYVPVRQHAPHARPAKKPRLGVATRTLTATGQARVKLSLR